jgi:hypothetical protein
MDTSCFKGKPRSPSQRIYESEVLRTADQFCEGAFVCPLCVVVLRRGFPLAKFVGDERSLGSSVRSLRLSEIPNQMREGFRWM